jgi:hypothetical protein
MRKTLAILAAAGCLAAAPVAAQGAKTTKTCTTLRMDLGNKTFNETYGSTSSTKAYAKCVSATKGLKSKTAIKATKKAVKTCAKKRKADSSTFAKKYGKKRAFAKCVAKRLDSDNAYSDPFGG